MSRAAQISFTGNATGDAELRFTPSGAAVANVTIAVTPREKDGDQWKDGEPAFYRVAAWRKLAENVAESVTRGARVTVVGTLKPREYEHNGEKRISLDVTADSVALDLTFDPAVHRRGERIQQQPAGDPWATGGGNPVPTGTAFPDDQPPF